MRNAPNKPKLFSSLDILGLLFTGLLLLMSFGPFSKIGTLRDWYFYDEYIKSLANTETTESQSKFYNIGDEVAMRPGNSKSYNITDASAKNVALVNEAKELIRSQLGNQSILHWEHFNDIQIKECNIDKISPSTVFLAYYEPEDNTIYCNRDTLNNSLPKDFRLNAIVHELMHALLECDYSAFENNTSAFHEGFTEYLAQVVCPTDRPSYYLCYCIAEVYVLDNGLDKAIELFMTGQAEESINQRLNRENLIQNINRPLYVGSYFPTSKDDDPIVLDVYLHYVQVTGIYIEKRIDDAISRIYPSYENIATIVYFNDLRQQITTRRNLTLRLFLDRKKIRRLLNLRISLSNN